MLFYYSYTHKAQRLNPSRPLAERGLQDVLHTIGVYTYIYIYICMYVYVYMYI